MSIRRNPKGAEADGAQMSLMDHLRELRSRLIKCAVAILVAGVASYIFYEQIFTFVTAPYCRSLASGDECTLYAFDLLAGFVLRMKVAMYGGFLFALPVILWQLWRFIMPGLYKNERRYALAFVFSSTVLFAAGATAAYLTLPQMIEWLAENGGPVTYLNSADRYFWLSALMALGFGIGFEFPLLLIALQLVGVLDNSTLRQFRRQAICGIVIIVAVITPGGDPISLIALSVPMYIFYEVSILVGRVITRRRARDAALTAP